MCFKKKKVKTQRQEKIGLLWSAHYEVRKAADDMHAYSEKYNDDSLNSTIKMLNNVARELRNKLAHNGFLIG